LKNLRVPLWSGERPGEAASIGAVFQRGFAAEIVCGQYEWLDHGPQIVQQHPIEQVTLTDLYLEELDHDPDEEMRNLRYIWETPNSEDCLVCDGRGRIADNTSAGGPVCNHCFGFGRFGLEEASRIVVRRYKTTEVYDLEGQGNRVYCDTPERRNRVISETCILYARIKAGLHVQCDVCAGKGKVIEVMKNTSKPILLPVSWAVTDPAVPCPVCKGRGWRVADQ